MESLIRWLYTHQVHCSWKHYLGIECPGCGMQTAFIELMKGHFQESICVFPALIPMMVMILFLTLHLIFKLSKGAFVLKILFIFTSSIMVISYILKVLTY